MTSRRRILVVDDDPSIRSAARGVLERAGYEVSTARNGCEAVTLLSESDYDVVLLDLVMPKLDGLGVIDELRRNNSGVLAHTYLLTVGKPDELTSLPVRGIIAKPLDMRALVAETKDCIGH